MNWRPVVESWYSDPAEKNALRSPSNSDTWVCMPDPGCVVKGFGMKVAQMPWDSATSRTTVRKVMMLSAVVSASAYRRSMGIQPLPKSLQEAIAVMDESELLAETLGERVYDFFLRNKRAEWDSYRGQVSVFERDQMLPVI